MLVGNKSDLVSKRQVKTADALDFATRQDLAFIETSDLDSTGVDDGFRRILAEIHKLRESRRKTVLNNPATKNEVPKGNRITLNSNTKDDDENSKSTCC